MKRHPKWYGMNNLLIYQPNSLLEISGRFLMCFLINLLPLAILNKKSACFCEKYPTNYCELC